MDRKQIALLLAAMLAGVVAFVLSYSNEPPPVVTAPAPPPPATDDVLVSTRNLEFGAPLRDGDVNWVPWPRDTIPAGAIRKSESPTAKDELANRFLLGPLGSGELVRRDKLSEVQPGGLIATRIAPGMRAIAIETSEPASAGGFVLPNDRVDVIATFRDGSGQGSSEIYGSELIVSNARVLAIGQNFENKNGEASATGRTATLEVTPDQAEDLLIAQRSGALVLALRPAHETQSGKWNPGKIIVFRSGVPR